jgi:hypothetical protein
LPSRDWAAVTCLGMLGLVHLVIRGSGRSLNIGRSQCGTPGWAVSRPAGSEVLVSALPVNLLSQRGNPLTDQ